MPLLKFVPPCQPSLQAEPPLGPLWSHEVKWDGYRVQVHKIGEEVTVFSRRGADFTRRAGRGVVEAVRRLACGSCILDGELVAFDADGTPSFEALHGGASKSRAIVVFDLLALDDIDLRSEPLSERRKHLRDLVTSNSVLVLSETFDDPISLLAACNERGLEGIVSKRIDKPYRSGPTHDWIKCKTAAWRALNRGRGKLFAKEGAQ